VGDEVIIQGKTTGALIQRVKSLQIEGESVEVAEGGEVGLLVEDRVRPGDLVYRRVKRSDS
jgi:putative protease